MVIALIIFFSSKICISLLCPLLEVYTVHLRYRSEFYIQSGQFWDLVPVILHSVVINEPYRDYSSTDLYQLLWSLERRWSSW